MKKTAIVLILSLGSLFSFAQVERVTTKQTDSLAKPGGDRMSKGKKKEMMRELDLTKEQRSKLKEIRQSNKAKKEAIENNEKLSDSDKKTQLRDLQKEQAQSVQSILTDEQKAKFKARRQEARKEKN